MSDGKDIQAGTLPGVQPISPGVVIAVIGAALALFCFFIGVTLDPMSAPQQAVQELRYVEAAIGALIAAVGFGVHFLWKIAGIAHGLAANAKFRAAAGQRAPPP